MSERSLVVIVPALSRPQNVAPLVASLYGSVQVEMANGWDVRCQFVCTPGDGAQIAAVRAEGIEPLLVAGAKSQYAVKINAAAAQATETWLLTAADDLRFHAGWLTAAIRVHEETGALVVGTNDLGNPAVKSGRHATHILFHRDYLQHGVIDDPGKLLADCYDHNAVDVEAVQTAMARGMWAFAEDSHVEHLHPLWHREVKRDATYAKGMAGAKRDRELYARRERLWQKAIAVREGRPLLLNLGCGPHDLRGFHNLDLPEWRFQDGLPDYEDESVAGITISHALMHLPLADWPAAFTEFARVLERGGVLRVTEDSTADPRSPRYGGFENPAALTTPERVVDAMENAGLAARRVRKTETMYRDRSLCQARHGAQPKVFFVEGRKP